MKSKLVIILFILVVGLVISNTSRNWKNNVYKYDKSGYHLYLPAIFVYNDLAELNFYSYIDEVYEPSGSEVKNYCITNTHNGKRVNRYSVGIAVLEVPFFLIAHFINTQFLTYPADGYSVPYQWGTLISNIFWVVIGLIIIRKYLRRYFSDNITATTLVLLAFGTNIYFYVAFSGGMSHTYSFFLFAAVLLFTDNLYNSNKVSAFYWLGLFMGMVFITRGSNILVAIIPLLWGVYNAASLKASLYFFKNNLKHILLGVVVFLAVALLQLGYWKYTTGQWLYDTYAGEGFIWTEPMIWEGLFGFRKGWFVYTPIAFVAVIGLYSMRHRFKMNIHAILFYLAINIYLTFCWWNWWYGGSFGCRALLETLAILSLPLAALIEQVAQKKSILLKISFGLLLNFLIFVNMFQSYQTYKGTLDWEKNTMSYYIRAFLKSNATKEDKMLLLPNKEYNNHMNYRRSEVENKH